VRHDQVAEDKRDEVRQMLSSLTSRSRVGTIGS
jgi:hypothetical protein